MQQQLYVEMQLGKQFRRWFFLKEKLEKRSVKIICHQEQKFKRPQKQGNMASEFFIKWIYHFSKFKPPGDILLIFDGASSHLNVNIVTVAEQ